MSQFLESLEQRLETNPWDTEAWVALLSESVLKMSDASSMFERFLAQFPTSVAS